MTTPRRWIAAILVLGAVAALVFAFTGDPSPSGAAPVAAGATPMWSARRVPQPIVDGVAGQRLARRLATDVAGTSGCYMVQSGGTVVASNQVDTPFIPASGQKLFVATAALETLGPDFTYETKTVAPSAVDNGAVSQLFLVGSGDPVLATDEYVQWTSEQGRLKTTTFTHLEALADAIQQAGVKRIPGGVVADDSRYDALRTVPGWSSSYLSDGDVGPLGALTVNDGFRTITPRRLVTDDPGMLAAQKLTDLLAARGIQVGAPSRGAAPQDAKEIAKVASPPLKDIVASMLSVSDALTAELLAKELAVRAGKPGTTADGTAAITASLQKLGVPVDNLHLADASGLHRDNRTTCRTLLATLDLGAQPKLATLWTGLSTVGQNGTLVDQLRGLGLDGKLHAKTGFLNGVSAFVGNLDGDQPLHFVFLDNGGTGYSQSMAEQIRRDNAKVLTTFPEAPLADQLVPQPA